MRHRVRIGLFAGAATLAFAGAAGAYTYHERAADRDASTMLGVSVGQIDDADVVTADGRHVGDVEAVLTNAAGIPRGRAGAAGRRRFRRDRLDHQSLRAVGPQRPGNAGRR